MCSASKCRPKLSPLMMCPREHSPPIFAAPSIFEILEGGANIDVKYRGARLFPSSSTHVLVPLRC